MTQQQLGYFWRPEEVSLQKDRNDFLSLRDEQKHIFTSNLRYQTLLDSVQGRGQQSHLFHSVRYQSWIGCMIAWDFIETIHSRSYTYIIKNVYPNPADVFDHILKDKHIIQRAEGSVTKTYDDLIEAGHRYALDGKGSTKELKRKLWLAMTNVNILEGPKILCFFCLYFRIW